MSSDQYVRRNLIYVLYICIDSTANIFLVWKIVVVSAWLMILLWKAQICFVDFLNSIASNNSCVIDNSLYRSSSVWYIGGKAWSHSSQKLPLKVRNWVVWLNLILSIDEPRVKECDYCCKWFYLQNIFIKIKIFINLIYLFQFGNKTKSNWLITILIIINVTQSLNT